MTALAIRYSRRALLALGAVATYAIAAPQQTMAQAWPQRPVTLIVSQAAGASPDVMARLVADRLARRIGQGVVIENKPGGANVIGATAAHPGQLHHPRLSTLSVVSARVLRNG